LATLDPFLDATTQVIRVGGRLRRADVTSHVKHPIVLPYRHHVTALLIRSLHETMGQVGRNHVLSQLREKYWMIQANSTVHSVLHTCVSCKRDVKLRITH